jgi:hypothetical protein
MKAPHFFANRAGRLRRRTFAVVFAAAIVVSGFALAGPAQATAGPRCTYGSSSGNVQTCVYVEGPNGTTHVDYAWASAAVFKATRTLEVCLRGPNGPIKCAGFERRHPDRVPFYALWQPDRNVTPGDYCANTYRLNSDGSDTQIGHVCVNVHS